MYDGCGCYDGSLTMAEGVNGGNPVIMYDVCPAYVNATPFQVGEARALFRN